MPPLSPLKIYPPCSVLTLFQADEATSSGDGLDDIFSKLGDGVNGMESEEELQGLLENMMSQLMSKAVLYEPLKELSDKVR